MEPDEILCEVPPGRLGPALEQHRTTGVITESRVAVFPEYVDVIIPMMAEEGFALVPCAGWTQQMSDERQAKLKEWRVTRAEQSAEVEAAQDAADAQLEAEGIDEDPRGIHTDRYDEIVSSDERAIVDEVLTEERVAAAGARPLSYQRPPAPTPVAVVPQRVGLES